MRGKTRVIKSWLVSLALNLTGWESGASFLNLSHSEVIKNQSNLKWSSTQKTRATFSTNQFKTKTNRNLKTRVIPRIWQIVCRVFIGFLRWIPFVQIGDFYDYYGFSYVTLHRIGHLLAHGFVEVIKDKRRLQRTTRLPKFKADLLDLHFRFPTCPLKMHSVGPKKKKNWFIIFCCGEP